MTKIRNVYIALHGKLFAEAHEQTQRAHTHVTIYLFANKKRINWRALGMCVCAVAFNNNKYLTSRRNRNTPVCQI